MADVDRLCELFTQFDRPFLEHIYRERGDMTRAVEFLLDVTSGPHAFASAAAAAAAAALAAGGGGGAGRQMNGMNGVNGGVAASGTAPLPQQLQMPMQMPMQMQMPLQMQMPMQMQMPLPLPMTPVPGTAPTGPPSDMILDYKTVVPPATGTGPRPSDGSMTPMRQSSVPPHPQSQPPTPLQQQQQQQQQPQIGLPEAVVEQRRAQMAQIVNFLHRHGIHGPFARIDRGAPYRFSAADTPC